jgi:hypothetical protein
MIVLAFHNLRHSVASLGAASRGERPLSPRAAIMSIASLSVFGWAAILLPLLAIAQ